MQYTPQGLSPEKQKGVVEVERARSMLSDHACRGGANIARNKNLRILNPRIGQLGLGEGTIERQVDFQRVKVKKKEEYAHLIVSRILEARTMFNAN